MKLNTVDLRKFRTAVARLKKAGLVQPSIDARSVRPTRPLTDAVERFRNVVRGNAKVLPLGKLNLTEREAIKRNFQISKPRGLATKIIVPHFPEEKVSAVGGNIKYSSPEGIRRLELPPVRTDTARNFFKDLKASKVKLPDNIKGQVFAARFYSGRTQTYSSLRHLLSDLNVYDSVVAAHGRKQTADVLRNIEIFTIPANEKQIWNQQKRLGRKILSDRQKARRNEARKVARRKAKREKIKADKQAAKIATRNRTPKPASKKK